MGEIRKLSLLGEKSRVQVCGMYHQNTCINHDEKDEVMCCFYTKDSFDVCIPVDLIANQKRLNFRLVSFIFHIFIFDELLLTD